MYLLIVALILLIASPCWAAFDMGFNFRATAGFVTDQSYASPVLGEAYPHTYTNTDGYSINGGYGSATADIRDRVNTNDPRIAGENFVSSVPLTFTADLGSGSAPGPGVYTVDIAAGDATASRDADFTLKDNTTALITHATTGSLTAGHFIDATETDVAATNPWTGTTVNKTFSYTTCTLTFNPGSAAIIAVMAHFRLTFVSGLPTAARLRTIMGVGL